MMSCRKGFSSRSPWIRSVMAWACLGCLIIQVSCTSLGTGPLMRVEDSQSRHILDSLQEKEAMIASLRGLFRASISASGLPFSQNLNGIFSYSRPDTLHLKGFIRIGVPVMDFHRVGNAYELVLPAEGKVFTGQVNPSQESTQWDQTILLSLRAMDAVLGKILESSPSEIQMWRGEDQYRIDALIPQSMNNSAEETYLVRHWVNAHTLELRSIEYLSSYEELLVSVECQDYRPVPDKASQTAQSTRLPFSVTATDHRPDGGSISLQFQEYVMNAA